MNRIFLLGLLLFSLSAHAQVDGVVICDHQLKSPHTVFQTALDNIYSFSYVRHAMDQARAEAGGKDVQFCTSSVALYKNIYQYFEHLILVDVRVAGATQPLYRFRFVFQNASVQAFHNVGGQPWSGLDAVKTDLVFSKMIDQATFSALVVPAETKNPIDMAKLSKTFQRDGQKVDLDSLSAIPVSAVAGKNIYLVTWMTKSSDNPYEGSIMTDGVLVAIAADHSVEVAENMAPQSDVLFPLETQSEDLMSKIGSTEAWADSLLKLSLP